MDSIDLFIFKWSLRHAQEYFSYTTSVMPVLWLYETGQWRGKTHDHPQAAGGLPLEQELDLNLQRQP